MSRKNAKNLHFLGIYEVVATIWLILNGLDLVHALRRPIFPAPENSGESLKS